MWNLHRSPHLWADPDAFRPERFEEVFTNDAFGGAWAGARPTPTPPPPPPPTCHATTPALPPAATPARPGARGRAPWRAPRPAHAHRLPPPLPARQHTPPPPPPGYNPDAGRGALYPNEVSSDFAFIPFGGGARKCIGDQFALFEAAVALAMLLRRFTFRRARRGRCVWGEGGRGARGRGRGGGGGGGGRPNQGGAIHTAVRAP